MSVNLPPDWWSAGQDTEYASLPFGYLFSQELSIPGTSIIRHSALTPAFGSRGGRSQTTRGTLSWVLGMHTLLHGICTASTSVILLINRRFVSFILQHLTPGLMHMINRWACAVVLLLSTTPTTSIQKVMQYQGLYAQHADTNSFFQKGQGPSRRVNS